MLTKFKLINTEGLSGLKYQGRLIPFDKIDDTNAEELCGKTHVLERVVEISTASAPVALLDEVTGSTRKSRN